MGGEQVSIQTYLDTRFDDLKSFLNEKFENLEKADGDLCDKVKHLEGRVKKLETWKAMTYGGFLVVGILIPYAYDTLMRLAT